MGILGSEEMCDGNEVKILGEAGLFDVLARKNIDQFQDKGVKKVITLDPHAYNAFKKHYPGRGGTFKVYHFTEILAGLIRDKKITLGEYKAKVTYHDPCYLGRHHNLYEPPRFVLRSIPGLELSEMRRSRVNAFCCGGGGGNFFTDIIGSGEGSPARVRAREALGSRAQVIAVACPQCAKMLADGIKAEDLEERLSVVDIGEIVRRSLSG